MGTALEVNPDIGLRELLQISQSNQWSVQFSPFSYSVGGRQGATIIRRSVDWKGLTKADDESFSEYQSRLSNANSAVASGLESARSMAMQTEGSEGLAVINKGGEMKIVSQAAAELASAGDENWTVEAQGLQSYQSAVDELVSLGGQRPVLPSVA